MNNLKFRQFVPTRLHHEGEFLYWGYGVLSDQEEFVAPTAPYAPSEQWTGLSDQDGIKIYAGDIVWTDHNIGAGGVVIHEGIVKYSYGSFVVLAANIIQTDIADLSRNKWKLKIVGNIHENPELLK